MGENQSDISKELAEDRTNWAEDRTILANERTFAGWMRTGLASVGVGLGFQAIFRAVEPTWMAKLAASLFICIGIFVFFAAWRKSSSVLDRLDAHAAAPVARRGIGLIAGMFGLGSALLLPIIWTLL